jgi:hypothetical protein
MLHKEVTGLRKTMNLEGSRIRLLGVSVSNLESEACDERQLLLFDEDE